MNPEIFNTPDLEPIRQAISVTNTTIPELMKISGVQGVHIAVKMDQEHCDLKTRAGYIKQHYDVEELREIAEEYYCRRCCCNKFVFGESCEDCSLYEFLQIIEHRGKELDPLAEEE